MKIDANQNFLISWFIELRRWIVVSYSCLCVTSATYQRKAGYCPRPKKVYNVCNKTTRAYFRQFSSNFWFYTRIFNNKPVELSSILNTYRNLMVYF